MNTTSQSGKSFDQNLINFPKPDDVHFQYCRNTQARFGKSYYFATRFFTKETRQAVWALYAFFRVPDEIVDSVSPAESKDEIMNKIDCWVEDWKKIFALFENQKWQEISDLNKNTEIGNRSILLCAAWVLHKFGVPYHYSCSFIDSMKQDIWKENYATYEELQQYMYGSAVVVGLILTYVLGTRDKLIPNENILNKASSLAYAMQLTNFLRDIKEDYLLRSRIYMPQTELSRFGIDLNLFKELVFQKREISQNPTFQNFMKFQIARARSLYRDADQGITKLSIRGRFPVALASTLYEGILDEIEKFQYNVFVERASTSLIGKIQLSFFVFIRLLFIRLKH